MALLNNNIFINRGKHMTHGGKRQGAGRKPVKKGKLATVYIRLENVTTWNKLKKKGEFVNTALENHCIKRTSKP